jgi:DNA-binding NarL/FixJ family response regulator
MGTAVKRTRIVLAGMPRLMLEIVERLLAKQPDLHVVARIAPHGNVRTAVRRHRADVLIVGASDDTGEGDAAADEAPQNAFDCRPATVVVVSESGRHGTVWAMRPQGKLVDDLSAERLIATIRATAPH